MRFDVQSTTFSAHRQFRSRDSSDGIATRYGLDGPEIEALCGRDFPHLSTPAAKPIQLPIQWVSGLAKG